MSPRKHHLVAERWCAPRVSGDEPTGRESDEAPLRCSPRERG